MQTNRFIYKNEGDFIINNKMEEEFNFIAKDYDENRKNFIPCFADFYEKTTNFIVSQIKEPKCILDLGAGTGLLSAFWYKYFPNSKYILVDIAQEMLSVAEKRFSGNKNVVCEVLDYSKKLPNYKFDAIISALSIHHLEDNKKEELFKKIYNSFEKGNLFVNYDQFCADSKLMNDWFNSYWENYLHSGNLSENDIELWSERRKLDKECSFEKEAEMLKRCGFSQVKCVYSMQKFSVIVAIK